MNRILYIIILFILSTIYSQERDSTGTLIVKITSFRNDSGQVRVALFNSKDGYPDKREKALKTIKSPIKNNQVEVTFKHLHFGIYAVGIFHDENSNDKFDTNWIGIPKEGHGASNDAKGKFGPPSFKNASFELKSDTLRISINVNY